MEFPQKPHAVFFVQMKFPQKPHAVFLVQMKFLQKPLAVFFVQMKFLQKPKKVECVQAKSLKNCMALFLKDADNPQKNELIHKLTQKEAGLMQAQQSLSNISGNRDLWIVEYRKELAEQDYRSGLEAAENKGLERGLAQGRMQKAFETAKNFLKMVFSPEQVAQGCGLSVQEVMQLI